MQCRKQRCKTIKKIVPTKEVLKLKGFTVQGSKFDLYHKNGFRTLSCEAEI